MSVTPTPYDEDRKTISFDLPNLGRVVAIGYPPFKAGEGKFAKIYDARGRSVYPEVNGSMTIDFYSKTALIPLVAELNRLCDVVPVVEPIKLAEPDYGDMQPTPPRYA